MALGLDTRRQPPDRNVGWAERRRRTQTSLRIAALARRTPSAQSLQPYLDRWGPQLPGPASHAHAIPLEREKAAADRHESWHERSAKAQNAP